MKDQISIVSSLIGDPTRSKILWILLDGKAYTATELATHADTSAQNMSMHLSKLVRADFLKVEKQGRHRYYRFSRDEVAYAIEAMANLIPSENRKKISSSQNNSPIKYCRTCYDHLAGKVGVLITDSLIQKSLMWYVDNRFAITKEGESFFENLGIDISTIKTSKRVFAKPCLDWSERKHHLAGSLGAALLERMITIGWMRRIKNSRAITITSKGQRSLYETFKIDL